MSMLKTQSPFHILLAIDGSDHSLAATQLTKDLSLPAGSRITALAVLTQRQAPGRGMLEAALKRAWTSLQDHVAVETGLLHGHPAEELTNFADEHQPDLMIVGAKGLRATLGILLGGVAQQVVEYSRWPVLVARAPYTGLRHVLLVIDGSPYSRDAVDYLRRFPLSTGAAVQVMHVLPPLPQPHAAGHGWPIMGADVPTMAVQVAEEESAARQAEEEERGGQALLAETINALKPAGIEAKGVLARGDAATEILKHIQANAIDLVVTGSRGLSAVKGWWLGSVSRKLVHYAGCSVMIVRRSTEAGV